MYPQGLGLGSEVLLTPLAPSSAAGRRQGELGGQQGPLGRVIINLTHLEEAMDAHRGGVLLFIFPLDYSIQCNIYWGIIMSWALS